MILPPALHAAHIKRGVILHSEIFEDIDHGKFFAVMGIAANMVVGFFFINSNINPGVMRRPEQFAMQYPLKRSNYPFLRYDSFLCATAIRKIPVDLLAQSMAEGKTKNVGQLTTQDLETVLAACRASRLFSPIDKRNYFYE